MQFWKNANFADRPTHRRMAFTLAELLTVMLILAVLLGLIIPAVNKARRSSQITAMKLQFQAIAAALEAYKADFRAYPMQGSLVSGFPANDPANTPRTDGTLAMALIGPGPSGLTNNLGVMNNTLLPPNYIVHFDTDGADGPGFKVTLSPFATNATLLTGVVVGASSLIVTVPNGIPTPTAAQVTQPPAFTTVSLGGPGSPDANITVEKFLTGGTSTTITLAAPLQFAYPAGTPVGLLAPVGKTWGPYLNVDKFPVAYVYGALSPALPPTTPAFPPAPTQAQPNKMIPVLLDIWGNPIHYFPAYNSFANNIPVGNIRVGGSPPTNITVGPLLGSPVGSLSIPNSPIPGANPLPLDPISSPAVFWDGSIDTPPPAPNANIPQPANMYWFTAGQRRAILFKLGDLVDNDDLTNPYTANAVMGGMICGPKPPAVAGSNPTPTSQAGTPIPQETFAVQLPYFLMSAGPDGIYTDLYYNSSTPATPNAAQYWQNIINKSDDIYSFDQ